MTDENLIFLKPVFTRGFDSAHKIQALNALCLMKAPKLCVKAKKKKKKQKYI